MRISSISIPRTYADKLRLGNLLNIKVALVGIFLLGLGLRAYCLDCRGLWYDEIASVDTARRGLDFMLNGRFGWMTNQTLGHYLLVWLTLQFADPLTTTVILRLPSLLAGALTAPIVYAIGSRTFGSRQGLLAAFMTTCATVLLGYSQDLRPYAMITFLTVLSVYCLLRAEQDGQSKWWLAFALLTIANLLNSYFALTLVLPALAPYLLWVLSRMRKHRVEGSPRLIFILGVLGSVMLVALMMLSELRQLPQTLPDLSQFSLGMISAIMIRMATWLPQFGSRDQIEYPVQIALLVISLLGLYVGGKSGGRATQGVSLFGLLLLMTTLLLALASTTTFVLQRYLLFQAPFYFLLISNGLVALLDKVSEVTVQSLTRRIAQTAVVLTVVALMSTFVLSAFNHIASNGYSGINDRPDYRAIAAYLSSTAKREDTVVVIDDPSHGTTVLSFYWQGSAPTAVYDARDPRLFQRKVQGDIYWVVGLTPSVNEGIAKSNDWAEVKKVPGAVVLKEDLSNTTMLDRMDNMVTGLEEAGGSSYLPVLLLRGGVYQAVGNVAEAVKFYKKVGTAIPLGAEHQRTSEGFQAIGESDRAWQEATLSKFGQPARPEIHRWMARKLTEEGYLTESLAETRIADALSGVPPGK